MHLGACRPQNSVCSSGAEPESSLGCGSFTLSSQGNLALNAKGPSADQYDWQRVGGKQSETQIPFEDLPDLPDFSEEEARFGDLKHLKAEERIQAQQDTAEPKQERSQRIDKSYADPKSSSVKSIWLWNMYDINLAGEFALM